MTFSILVFSVIKITCEKKPCALAVASSPAHRRFADTASDLLPEQCRIDIPHSTDCLRQSVSTQTVSVGSEVHERE